MSKDNEQPPEKNAGENQYPSSPGADESPQEPVSEDESTDSGQDNESEQKHSGGEDDNGGDGEGAETDGDGESSGEAQSGQDEPKGPPETYPSDPEKTENDPDSGSGEGTGESSDQGSNGGSGRGPGAAKASESHPHQVGGPEEEGVGRQDAAADSDVAQRQQFAPGWFNVPPPPSHPPSNAGTGHQEDPGPDPSPPASAWQAAPYQEPPRARARRKTSKAPLFLGIGVAGALIVGVVLIATMLSGTGETEAQTAPDSNGIIAEEVSPFDFEEGQCFTDFSDATQPATVVTCETPHQAQLVNTFHYKEEAEFPGEEALAKKAEELCRNTRLSEEANQYEGQLRQQTAYPQTESWQAGDRRVDCFIRTTSGQITSSLIS